MNLEETDDLIEDPKLLRVTIEIDGLRLGWRSEYTNSEQLMQFAREAGEVVERSILVHANNVVEG